MTIQEFITKYTEAFGESVPLPVAFGYSDKAATEVRKIPRCMVGAIRKVCDGEPLTLSAGNVLCGGGSHYTAFAPCPTVRRCSCRRRNITSRARNRWRNTLPGWASACPKSHTSISCAWTTLTIWTKWREYSSSPFPTCCPAYARGRFTTTTTMMRYARGSLRAVAASWPSLSRRTRKAAADASSACSTRRRARWFPRMN